MRLLLDNNLSPRLVELLTLQGWDVATDLLDGHPVGDHRHDGRDRDTQTTDRRDAGHEVGIHCDPCERHAANGTAHGANSPSLPRAQDMPWRSDRV